MAVDGASKRGPTRQKNAFEAAIMCRVKERLFNYNIPDASFFSIEPAGQKLLLADSSRSAFPYIARGYKGYKRTSHSDHPGITSEIAKTLYGHLIDNSPESLDAMIRFIDRSVLTCKDWSRCVRDWEHAMKELSDNPFRLVQLLVILHWRNAGAALYRKFRNKRKYEKWIADIASDIVLSDRSKTSLIKVDYKPLDEIEARFRFYILGALAMVYEKQISEKEWSELAPHDLEPYFNGQRHPRWLNIENLELRLEALKASIKPLSVKIPFSLSFVVRWDSKEEYEEYKKGREKDSYLLKKIWLKKYAK